MRVCFSIDAERGKNDRGRTFKLSTDRYHSSIKYLIRHRCIFQSEKFALHNQYSNF